MGKTTTPFRYDLNQIPYDYAVELGNRFKGLDLIDRVPDELWTEVGDTAQKTGNRACELCLLDFFGGHVRVDPEHSSFDRPSFWHVGGCCDTPHTALSTKGTTGCEASLSVFKSHLSTYCPFALI